MKITNELNLPEAIVEAVRNDPYDAGDADISVTQLVGPVQLRLLRLEYEHLISEDVSDRIWALLGQAVHVILERAAVDTIAEERLYAEVGGFRISGQLDSLSYSPCTLSDYKVTSAWTGLYGPREDWIKQLNVYAFLARENGIEVDNLEVIAFYRDWSRIQATRNADYPQMQVERVPLPLWTEEAALDYIWERLRLHFGRDIVECTDDERWAKPAQWAVMKAGRKSAMRVLESQDEAVAWANDKGYPLGITFWIEERPRQYPRCENYCPVAPFCEQWLNTAKE